jgi:hypothetical protein
MRPRQDKARLLLLLTLFGFTNKAFALPYCALRPTVTPRRPDPEVAVGLTPVPCL